MKNFHIKYIKTDYVELNFKKGLNYVVGKNASGKTAIFSQLKYCLGIKKSVDNYSFSYVDVCIVVSSIEYIFSRYPDDSFLSISFQEQRLKLKARSKELDQFFNSILNPQYEFSSDKVSVYSILDFIFISDSEPKNKKNLEESLKMICSIDSHFLLNVSSDMKNLKTSIKKDKDFLDHAIEVGERLIEKLTIENAPLEDKQLFIIKKFYEESKEAIDKKTELFLQTERLLRNVEKDTLSFYGKKLDVLNAEFNELIGLFDLSLQSKVNIQNSIESRNDSLSYAQTTILFLISILSIAKLSTSGDYNYPNILVNDDYLSNSIDLRFLEKIPEKINRAMKGNEDFQYIEFTRDFNLKNKNYSNILMHNLNEIGL